MLVRGKKVFVARDLLSGVWWHAFWVGEDRRSYVKAGQGVKIWESSSPDGSRVKTTLGGPYLRSKSKRSITALCNKLGMIVVNRRS